jgi:hypothetical protein
MVTTNYIIKTRRIIEVTVWVLFFAWISIGYLTTIPYLVILLGSGIILLGGQITRNFYDLKVQVFKIVMVFCLMLGSLLEFLETGATLVPVLIIVSGAAMCYPAMSRKLKKK